MMMIDHNALPEWLRTFAESTEADDDIKQHLYEAATRIETLERDFEVLSLSINVMHFNIHRGDIEAAKGVAEDAFTILWGPVVDELLLG
jgi:ferritin-like metal-binding protein YciE